MTTWRYRDGSLDEVYLDGDLVLFPIEASETDGWVRFYRADREGNATGRAVVEQGHVDVVRCLDCDPFADQDGDDGDDGDLDGDW